MGKPSERFPMNAESMNAVIDALGAVVMSLSDSMPPEQRAVFAQNLAKLAKNAENRGMVPLETLLIDLHRVAK